ncbi:acyltransferase [Chengkuizengella axinellae]|uniref:Acyltransferase n=1 Tax=Chengkuizengella axinellae TaxID=3064388 RepID=A0ABT9J656_9BACL|nr:acyltransferase [Chengkuizengella sp. 2205SS18-9]MDP5276434.1 acyltransferase [Chengkuizengella sp. 2205SS18-9]
MNLDHKIQQRNADEFSILKSLAFLAVVFQSSITYVMNQSNIKLEESFMLGMLYNFSKFSAPVFIFIVGFHLIHQHKEPVKYKIYIKDKVWKLILPYLYWSLIYVIFFTNLYGLSLLVLFEKMLTGSAAPHLWYVIMVFQFHLVFPILFYLFQWVKKHLNSVKFVICTVGFVAISYFLLLWLASKFIFTENVVTEQSWMKYIDRSFLFYLFYFFLGGLVALTLPSWRKLVLKYRTLNKIIFLGMFAIVGYELISHQGIAQIDLGVSTYLKPSMFLYVCAEIILLYRCSMAIVKGRSIIFHVLKFIGKYTYTAYLAHLFFLQIIAGGLKFLHVSGQYIILSLVILVIVTIMSVGFSFFIDKTPGVINKIRVLERFNYMRFVTSKEGVVYSKILRRRD